MTEDSKLEYQANAAEAELASTRSPVVDAAAEKVILRKLDSRIIPMIMLLYLMSFMDRGMHYNGLSPCLYDTN
jgi:hypothetical protein